MAPGLTALYVYVGSTDTAILSAMSTHSPLDAQLSSSWTWSPSDPSTDDPYFEKFAAQGQTMLQAAGDSGAYTSFSRYVYPADDAHVTVVGGTDLQTSGAGGAWVSETVWVDGGGGYFTPDAIPIPSWQQLAGVITSANEGPQLCGTPRTSRQKPISTFTSAPTKPPALQTNMAGPVLRRPCGPATWLWSINRRLPTATRRSASLIRPFMRLVWAQAMTPISTTSPAAVTAIRQ